MSMDSRPSSVLAELGMKLYRAFADARKAMLEDRWNENRDNFNAVFKAYWKVEEGEDWRSKTTPDTVRQKVLTAFSIMADIMLQGGKIPFALQPSERLLGRFTDAKTRFAQDVQYGAETIDGQYARCHADRAMMSNIMAGGMYGITYAKRVRETYSSTGYESIEIPGVADASGVPASAMPWVEQTFSEEGPGWVFASNWEVYADPEANFDPRRGQGWFHCRLVSPYELRQKKGKPWFLDMEIDKVLAEAKKRRGTVDAAGDNTSLPPYLRNITERKRNIWYREAFIRIPRETVDAYEKELRAQSGRKRDEVGRFLEWTPPSVAEAEDDGDDVWVHFVMADDHVVRYVRVDAEDNPMYSAKWEDVVDEPGGRGVADAAKSSHEGIAKTMRAIEDNVNWAENVQGIMKPRMIKGGLQAMKPGQVLEGSEDCKSASDAFMQIKVELLIDGLVALLAQHEKYGDWSTMFPKITQGQIEKNQATATEIMEQSERADKYTGGVVRNYDEGLIEPITTDVFRDNMRDPNITKGRGDFIVQALGFQSFKDRISRMRTYRTVLELALLDPEIRSMFKLRGIVEPMVKAAEIDVGSVMNSDEEMQANAERTAAAQQPQPQPPDELTVARAEKERAVGQAATMKAQTDAAKVELDAEKAEDERRQRAVGAQMGVRIPGPAQTAPAPAAI